MSQQLTIDPRIVPWSFRGSLLCLATRSGENGCLTPATDVYLVSHSHPAGLPLFALRPHADGPLPAPSGFHVTPSPVTFSASPSRLDWIKGTQVLASATFALPSVIRLKGALPLSFDTASNLAVEAFRCWAFRLPVGSDGIALPAVDFTSRPDSAFRFVALKGDLDIVNGAPSPCNDRRITIRPDEGSTEWELLIIEREKSDVLGGHSSRSTRDIIESVGGVIFDQTEATTRSAFDSYVSEMCPWLAKNSTHEATDRYACYVMWTSTVRPGGLFKRESVLMSKLWMNKVWSWDNCFNCLALATMSEEAALHQMLVPFDHITPEGRLPDSICYAEILYDFTKPPIYGWTLNRLLEVVERFPKVPRHSASEPLDRLERSDLENLYDKISVNTLFWYRERMGTKSQIPWYSHGNDSGWDNSTAYDDQTICCSPDLAAFLIVQTDALARIASYLQIEGGYWTVKRETMITALLEELWDDKNKTFMFKDAYTGATWTSDTLLKYLPLVASAFLPAPVVEALAHGVAGHLTRRGLATELPTSTLYEADGYWRGPIWAPPTIMIETSLRQAGYTDLADEIYEKFVLLCVRSGFAENYDALTGQGNRDLSYTWTD